VHQIFGRIGFWNISEEAFEHVPDHLCQKNCFDIGWPVKMQFQDNLRSQSPESILPDRQALKIGRFPGRYRSFRFLERGTTRLYTGVRHANYVLETISGEHCHRAAPGKHGLFLTDVVSELLADAVYSIVMSGEGKRRVIGDFAGDFCGSLTISKKVQLSSAGIARSIDLEEPTFSIWICRKEYRIPRFQASFFSPHIHRQLMDDPTLTQFVVDNVSVSDDCIQNLFDLMNGKRITVHSSNFDGLRHLAIALGHHELEGELVDVILSGTPLDMSNIAVRWALKSSYARSISDEVQFIASNIENFSAEDLSGIQNDGLEEILSSDKLNLPNEDWLVKMIHELGSEYFWLLRYVECKYLSYEGVDEYVDMIDPTLIDAPVWQHICNRLRCGVAAEKSVDVITYGSAKWSGILRHLKQICGGNVHQNGIVMITSSGDGSSCCYQVADEGWNGSWWSSGIQNSWISFDFKDRSVSPTHYTINSGNSGYYLRNWDLEGSNDNSTWQQLDQQNGTSVLNGVSQIHTFTIPESSNLPFFRYIRLRQTNTDIYGDHYLSMSGFEIFGKLRSTKQLPSTRRSLVDRIEYTGSNWSGILSRLKVMYGGNVHEKGTVEVKSSGDNGNSAYQIVGENWSTYWISTNQPGSWILLDFKTRSVSPTHYTIKSDNGGYYIKAWAVEGSNDNTTWTQLDSQSTNDHTSVSVVRTYSIQNASTIPFFKYIRLRQTSTNANNSHYLALSGFEIFGRIKPKLSE
jgi:hypothetical protein